MQPLFLAAFPSIITIFNIRGEDRCDTCCSAFLLILRGRQLVFGHDCFAVLSKLNIQTWPGRAREGNEEKVTMRMHFGILTVEQTCYRMFPTLGKRDYKATNSPLLH